MIGQLSSKDNSEIQLSQLSVCDNSMHIIVFSSNVYFIASPPTTTEHTHTHTLTHRVHMSSNGYNTQTHHRY